MLYFVPAWYAGNEWKEREERWYVRRTQTETDDTVKQIQLFRRNKGSAYQILLLSYAPNFRHFLHRQGIFRAPYWSVFDAVQEVRGKKQKLFSFRHLNWPKGIEFIYTPFSILAMSGGKRYAQIEFGEDGNIIEVDLYKDGQIGRSNQYDDRGFVSCTTVYENGEKRYEQYLTDRGVWKLSCFADGHVEVNPQRNCYLLPSPEGGILYPFRNASYASMEEVVEEVLAACLQTTDGGDIFCAAAHGRHIAMLGRQLAGRRTIYSIFENRLSLAGNEAALTALSRGGYIVADSEENLALLEKQGALQSVAKINIPPYDTRLAPGISRTLPVQKILLPTDSLRAEVLEAAVTQLAAYLGRNEKARVHLFTRDGAYGRESELLAQVGRILEQGGYPPEWARRNDEGKRESSFEREEQIPILFTVEQCVDDLSVTKCMREQRIMVDLADTPDHFLQIFCVSMGIPQIVKKQTRYVVHGGNGQVNRDILKLGEEIQYYLESLSNWNRAVIHSYELGKVQTAESLIGQWKEVIDSIENNTGIAAGK